MGGEREILDEQIAYYRARAGEYDRTSTPAGEGFDPLFDPIRDRIRELVPGGRVLELAAGTGQWTGVLAELADELTVSDASPEMLELNAAKLRGADITYRVMDAFTLAADGAWDVVFFGFFLSHVPRGRFEAFWKSVARLLAPGGRVVFVDEAPSLERTEAWADADRDVVWRTLSDGTRHRAIKVLWRPEDLAERLRSLGWRASVHPADPFFYWGTASR